jgi:hypothetical protein
VQGGEGSCRPVLRRAVCRAGWRVAVVSMRRSSRFAGDLFPKKNHNPKSRVTQVNRVQLHDSYDADIDN